MSRIHCRAALQKPCRRAVPEIVGRHHERPLLILGDHSATIYEYLHRELDQLLSKRARTVWI